MRRQHDRYSLKKIIKTRFTYIFKLRNRDNRVLNDGSRRTNINEVNLHWWSTNNKEGFENVGDYLSTIVTDYMIDRNEIDKRKKLTRTKHLYSIGSIIQGGAQNCVVWGSGFKNGNSDINLFIRLTRRIDVRLVRGPLTRDLLLKYRYKCPELYGDPAILLPMIYQPKVENIKEYTVVLHHDTIHQYDNSIETLTDDFTNFINMLCSSKLVISSSLHGIILAESYGIQAILLKDKSTQNLFKYKDYYFSTNRYNFPIANSIEEALTTKPLEVPDFTKIRENIINTFPSDLWEE